MKNKKNAYHDEQYDTTREKIMLIIAILLIITVIICLLLKSGKSEWETDYSQSIYDNDGNINADPGRINISVLPDYTVSKDSPYIMIPYPAENVHEISFRFYKEKDGSELYATKRIRPGTVVRIPAGDFCSEGDVKYNVAVDIYDPNLQQPVFTDITLQTRITNERI